jgi:hypothetical protein
MSRKRKKQRAEPLYVSKDRASVVMSDGSSVPVTDLLDDEGDSLDDDDDHDDIRFVIAGPTTDGRWFNIQLEALPDPVMH